MRWAILDTAVYIDHWEGVADVEQDLARVRQAFIIRHSSVVLSELRRGARTPAARRRVAALYALAAVQWPPTAQDWWAAGDLVRTIGDAHDWEVAKRREFQNDALIALTARRQAATLVTRNRRDFALLEKKLAVSVLYV
jgi:predicted nucleic acid-binding protein